MNHCRSADQVTLKRSLAFAALVSAMLVALWPIIREIGLLTSVATQITWPKYRDILISDAGPMVLTRPALWRRVCAWEAWSLTRWWILFGLLAIAFKPQLGLGSRKPSTERLCRLLLFAPWLVLLEVGFLFGVWIDSPRTVPEPSTLFFDGQWRWDRWLERDWLIRGAVPLLVVGWVFFRSVLGQRVWLAALWAVMLTPVGLCFSVFWSMLWPGRY